MNMTRTMKWTICCTFLCLAMLSVQILASDLIEVLPLNSKVLVVHFDDGYIDYYGYHETSGDDEAFSDPLDLELAMKTSSYYLSSEEDDRFSEGITPVSIGRKSKPMEISQKGVRVDEHWIYLELNDTLCTGKEYTLWIGDLAENTSGTTFVFDEFKLRSPAIRVNQLGYKPSAGMKYAYLAYWMGDKGPLYLDDYQGNKFYIADNKTRNIVFEGVMSTKRRDLTDDQDDNGNMDLWGTENNFFSADVWELDFSDFDIPGEYVIVVEGIGHSYPFKINEDIYREAFYLTCRGLFQQRAGIAKEEEYFGKWAAPRNHHPDDGADLRYSKWPAILAGEGDSHESEIKDNEVGPLDDWGWGWYHDAGDWDAYVHHTAVPRHLLAAYELAPQNFSDGELNTVESGNGIPDLLDEAGWLINAFRRNQQEDGGIAGGRILSDWNKKREGYPSWEDERPWYVCGEDPFTTYSFAGLAAQYAFCLEIAGITDSTDKLIAEAELAFAWANDNPSPLSQDLNSTEVKGEDLNDLKMYAAACLYKMTGNEEYQTIFKDLNQVESATASLAPGAYNQDWAVWAYVTAPDYENTDTILKNMLKTATVNYGKEMVVETAKKRSARVGYNYWMPPVIGSTTTPIIIEAMYAYKFAEGNDKQELYDYMHTTADYFLGSNPMNILWITGLGDRRPEHILHLDSRWDNVDPPIQGIVPYGPYRHGDWFDGENAAGWWDADYAKVYSYPDRYSWPISECWYDNRYSVADGEFTVHQNVAPATAAYGFLCDESKTFIPNTPPQISLTTPSESLEINESKDLTIEVNTDDDEWVAKVAYYFNHHKIAESVSSPFNVSIESNDLMEGTWHLNAIAWDNEGERTRSDSVEITVSKAYMPEITSPAATDTFIQGESLNIAVNIPDYADVTISKVVIHLNGQLVTEDTEAPFELTIDSLFARNNEIMATATYQEGFSSSDKVIVYAKTVALGVNIIEEVITAHEGEFRIIDYQIIPDDAINQNVSWNSLNEEVATVDPQTGLVSILKEGEAHIVVVTEDGGYSDTTLIKVVPPPPTGPYNGKPILLPGKIEAENYDLGGEGLGFHDETPGNSEEEYRFESVDIGSTYDGAPAYHVTGINDGEWLNYTVFIPESNFYDFTFRYTNGLEDGKVVLKLDGKTLKTVTIPVAKWYPFTDYTEENVYLVEGEHVLQVYFEDGPYTFNYFDISCDECSKIVPDKVNISPHKLDIAVGGRVNMTYGMIPADATETEVNWISTNDEVIHVDGYGVATALMEGTAKIVVKTKSRNLTDTCMVSVLEESSALPGVNYEYFEGGWDQLPDFNALNPVQTGSADNFDISLRLKEDSFAFRFNSNIHIFEEGTYAFYCGSDDGSRIFINGELVADNDGLHAYSEQGGSLPLDSGLHQIEVQFFEKGGGETLEVKYEGPNINKDFIPDSILGRYVFGGEIVDLNGIDAPENIIIALEQSVFPEISFDPADASDTKIQLNSSDPTIAAISEYGEIFGESTGQTEVTVTARDGGFSDIINVSVVNDAPLVNILEPVGGTDYLVDDSIVFKSEAIDTIGGIRSVSYYQNDEIIDSAVVEPYQVVWKDIPAGDLTIKAVAHDMYGKSGESETINISVIPDHVSNVLRKSIIRAYPNPFKNEITFEYLLSDPCDVTLEIYNITGQKVTSLVNGTYLPGWYTSSWNRKNKNRVDAGVYYYRFVIERSTDKKIFMNKIVIVE